MLNLVLKRLGETTKSSICKIQSSFVTSNVFLVQLSVNEIKPDFALLRLSASRIVPLGHIATDPENFAN